MFSLFKLMLLNSKQLWTEETGISKQSLTD
jgi:hypothetical protein